MSDDEIPLRGGDVPEGPDMEEYLQEALPPGGLLIGYIAGLMYFDSEGNKRWRSIGNLNMPMMEAVGLLRMMELKVIATTPGHGIPFIFDPDGKGDC